MKSTGIEWTDFSSNPLKYRNAQGKTVWACVKVSPGCANCYAEDLGFRYNRGQPFVAKNMEGLTPFVDDDELHKIFTAKKVDKIETAGKRCFIGDMTDIFGDWVPFHLIDRLFGIFMLRKDMTFQILTKRPERMREYFASRTLNDVIINLLKEYDSGPLKESPPRWLQFFQMLFRVTEAESARGKEWKSRLPQEWPLPNVWLGTSVENQYCAEQRIPHLLRVPAALRFLSCEPLLGPIDFSKVSFTVGKLADSFEGNCLYVGDVGGIDFAWTPRNYIGWMIVGGESGTGDRIRGCDIDNIRGVVKQCQAAGIPPFVKQLGSRPVEWKRYGITPLDSAAIDCHIVERGSEPDDEMIPLKLIDDKGGDMQEWPADLRMREFPKGAIAS